jgi:hypothetical protein
LFDINIRPRDMSVDDLHVGFLKLVKQLYSEEETQTRRRRFRERLKTSPNFAVPRRNRVNRDVLELAPVA